MKEGWELIKFEELCELTRGHNPPKSKFINEPKEGYVRFYQIRDGWSEEYKVYVPETSQLHTVLPEDMLMVAYRHIGKVFRGVTGAFNVALCKISNKSSEILDNDFLFYMIPSEIIKGELMKSSERSLIPSMSVMHLKSLQLPIPPLSEQKQIVAILDKAFAAIDQAKTNIEKNIANAKELFQSKLNDIFSQKGDGWEEKKLIEICEVKDGTHDSPKYIGEEEGIPFVTQKNILESGISFEKTKFISQDDHNDFYKRSNVAYNDILFAMIGANRGMACIVDDKRVFSIKNVGLIKSNESYRGKFILYYLKSQIAQKYVAENSSGSAQGFIGLGKLRAFPIPYTNIESQMKIELIVESLNESVNSIIYNYSLKLNSLEDLKKSILQKAFAGELTNNDI